MKANIAAIGNSQGVRIPKKLLEKSELGKNVELKAKRGEIRIVAAQTQQISSETALLSHSALAKQWSTKEEDEAWSSL